MAEPLIAATFLLDSKHYTDVLARKSNLNKTLLQIMQLFFLYVPSRFPRGWDVGVECGDFSGGPVKGIPKRTLIWFTCDA